MARLSRVSFVVLTNLSKVGHVWRRTRTRGLSQGWVCAKTYLMNAWLRLCNIFCLHPRVECPCCGWRGYAFRWVDCGRFTVPQVECPGCMGHERHRMLHIFLKRTPPSFLSSSNALVLHFSPEPQIAKFIESHPHLSGFASDYDRGILGHVAMPGVRADMQRLPFPDGLFDGLFCFHVLEHVPDDRKGIAELLRVIKPGGEAVIMVPFMMGIPATREYGAPDPDMWGHVREYSQEDFHQRLGAFDWRAIRSADIMTEDERLRYQIPSDSEVIHLCSVRSL